MDTLKDKVKARFHRLSSRELIYGLVAVVVCLVAAMAVQLQPGIMRLFKIIKRERMKRVEKNDKCLLRRIGQR